MQGRWVSKPALFLTRTGWNNWLASRSECLDQCDSYWKDKQSLTGCELSYTNNIFFFPNQICVHRAREQEAHPSPWHKLTCWQNICHYATFPWSHFLWQIYICQRTSGGRYHKWLIGAENTFVLWFHKIKVPFPLAFHVHDWVLTWLVTRRK